MTPREVTETFSSSLELTNAVLLLLVRPWVSVEEDEVMTLVGGK